MSEAALEARGLVKHYGRVRAVDGIDLTVPRGSVFGLIGPNGAGKTTTFSLACGWVRPTAGTLAILGRPPRQVAQLKGRLGALPQDAALPPNTRLEHSLVYYGRLQGLSRDDAKKETARVLTLVGLSEWRRVPARNLSHGMAKRVGLAQAFIGSPELVLLDEPTAGLDPKSAHQLRETFLALKGKSTLVISSHNLFELEALCDHAAILDRGKVVAHGPMSELTAADTEIVIDLAREDDAVYRRLALAVEQVPDVHAASVEPGTTRMVVRFAATGKPAHPTISAVLKAILEAGGQVGEVRRGQGLERAVLKLT